MMTLGVIVARFQVPELSTGHKLLISTAITKFDHVGFVLGESAVRSARNPLTYEMRQGMVESYLGSYRPLFIVRAEDYPGEDEAWSRLLDMKLNQFYESGIDITLIGGRDCFIPHYMGRHKTEHIQEFRQAAVSLCGAEIRENVDVVNSADFRRGVIWQMNHGK